MLHKRLLLDEILDSDAQRRRGSTFLPGVSSNALSLLPSPKPFERPTAQHRNKLHQTGTKHTILLTILYTHALYNYCCVPLKYFDRMKKKEHEQNISFSKHSIINSRIL